MNIKAEIAQHIAEGWNEVEAEFIEGLLEYPPNPEMGDVSLPCFKLSKQLRKSPQIIAESLKSDWTPLHIVQEIQTASGYVNFYLNKTVFADRVIREVLSSGSQYGSQQLGQGKKIVIDFSSPNIAKPFHVGHLRSTVIGRALYNIFEHLGFECIGINHLGDWGTQFGKLIVAYKRWGSKEDVENGRIDELLRLYVKFHDEADKAPELEDEARAWFVKLEQGDEEALQLWKWFVEISLKEFNKIYDLLGVKFDSYAGESFYNDKTRAVIEQLKEKNLLVEDDGAQIVKLDEYGMAPALMLKKDGSTLYHTRDVAAAKYRHETYDFEKAIYVTDYAQNLHFQQWFKIIELMGCDWADRLVHVPFGRVSLEGVSLSTRKGNVVKLDDLLQQSIQTTLDIINNKNPELDNKEEVARQVGVGAVIFNDLSSNRIKDIVFSWEEALNFDGETGPYVQYTHARACSVLRKANDGESIELDATDICTELLDNLEAQLVIKELYLFPEKVIQAMEKLEPSLISRYLVDLAQAFNRFYHECPILKAEDQALRQARLALVKAVQLTLRSGLRLIGLESPVKI